MRRWGFEGPDVTGRGPVHVPVDSPWPAALVGGEKHPTTFTTIDGIAGVDGKASGSQGVRKRWASIIT